MYDTQVDGDEHRVVSVFDMGCVGGKCTGDGLPVSVPECSPTLAGGRNI